MGFHGWADPSVRQSYFSLELRALVGSVDNENRKDVLMNNKQSEFNEQEFLAFAKSYLSEEFPNPDRVGCRAHSELMHLAEHPRDADPLSSEHLSCCSLCFKEYMEILAVLKGTSKG